MAKAKKEEPKDEDDKGAEKTEGGEGGGEGAEGAPEAAGGSKLKKIILFVVAPLVLLGGAGAGLYFTGMLDGLLGKGEAVEEGEAAVEGEGGHGEKKEAKKKEGGHGEAKKGGHGEGAAGGSESFVVIPTMIVNLNSDDGTPRYLRLSVQLELDDTADKAAVEAIIPKVVDQFQTYLRELRVRDLRGSGGIYRLQMELLWRVNQAAAPAEIKDVLFQEILIQ